MPAEEKTPAATEPKQKRLEYITPPNLPRVYANNIVAASTRFDLRILFGEIADSNDEAVTIQHCAQVTISWYEAKLLAEFLHANVRAFEELNGPLKLPNIPPKMVTPEPSVDSK